MLIINPKPTVNVIVIDHRPARAPGRRTGMISQHHRRGFRHTAGSLDLTPISGPCFGPQDSKNRAKVISPSIGAGPRGVDSTETQYQDTVFHGNSRSSSTETVSTPDHSSCFRASRSGSEMSTTHRIRFALPSCSEYLRKKERQFAKPGRSRGNREMRPGDGGTPICLRKRSFNSEPLEGFFLWQTGRSCPSTQDRPDPIV